MILVLFTPIDFVFVYIRWIECPFFAQQLFRMMLSISTSFTGLWSTVSHWSRLFYHKNLDQRKKFEVLMLLAKERNWFNMFFSECYVRAVTWDICTALQILVIGIIVRLYRQVSRRIGYTYVTNWTRWTAFGPWKILLRAKSWPSIFLLTGCLSFFMAVETWSNMESERHLRIVTAASADGKGRQIC